MVNKQIQFSESELQHYNQLEGSIQHWSVEHVRVQLQAERLKSAVASMYDARQQLVHQSMKAAGINPAHVHRVHVNVDDGTVTVSVDESVPNPEMDQMADAPAADAPEPSGP